jgi:hypothetical protein
MSQTRTVTCCICSTVNHRCGNNPHPIFPVGTTECCDYCNASVVIPARAGNLDPASIRAEIKERQS